MAISRDDVVGKSLGKANVTLERGPLQRFAEAVTDTSPIYQRLDAAQAAGFADIPVPPTYWFSAAEFWGAFAEDQPADAVPDPDPMRQVMGELFKTGGMILHGEQEYTYHRPAVAGERLRSESVVLDLYTKESGGRTMTFLVTQTTYRDEAGEPVVTATMNLIHRS